MICVEYFFPKSPAKNDYPAARLLRRAIIPLIVLHIIIGCLGIAFVTFLNLLTQIWYTGLLYSSYMTLRTWIVWLYMISLTLNVVVGLFSVWLYSDAAFIVYFIMLALYALMCLKMWRDSMPWRNIDNADFYL